MLLAFITIVMGSQQMLVLPTEKLSEPDDDLEESTALNAKEKHDKTLRESEKHYHQVIIQRLRGSSHPDRQSSCQPNGLAVFALQAPIMLLALTVMAFLTGLCSVVFAPLAHQSGWNDNAKVCMDEGISLLIY